MDKSTALFIVRHGQTEYNIKGIVQGWCDSPLTEKGVKDAITLGKGLKDIKFDAVYSSDSGRALTTARNILDGMVQSININSDPGIKELYLGSLEGTKAHGNIMEKAIEHAKALGLENKVDIEYLHSLYNKAAGEPAAEPMDTFIRRLEASLLKISSENPAGSNILVISHGLAIMAMIYAISQNKYVPDRISNLSVTKVCCNDMKFNIIKQNDMHYYESGLLSY